MNMRRELCASSWWCYSNSRLSLSVALSLSVLPVSGLAASYGFAITHQGRTEAGNPNWTFNVGGLPPLTWNGTVGSKATADEKVDGWHETTGVKLTKNWSPTAPYTFTPGTVGPIGAAAAGSLGSVASITSTLDGGATYGFLGIGIYGKADVVVNAQGALGRPLGTQEPSWSCLAMAKDPLVFGSDGIGFEGESRLDLSLSFPYDGSSLPTSFDHPASWEMSYSYYAIPEALHDVDQFFASSPELIATVSFGVSADGVSADYLLNTGSSFSLTFSKSEEQFESDLQSALTDGWSGDLDVLDASVDFSGNDNVSIGIAYDFSAAASIPEPSPSSLLVYGLALMWLVEGRRKHCKKCGSHNAGR